MSKIIIMANKSAAQKRKLKKEDDVKQKASLTTRPKTVFPNFRNFTCEKQA
jgi:hypothetical protein